MAISLSVSRAYNISRLGNELNTGKGHENARQLRIIDKLELNPRSSKLQITGNKLAQLEIYCLKKVVESKKIVIEGRVKRLLLQYAFTENLVTCVKNYNKNLVWAQWHWQSFFQNQTNTYLMMLSLSILYIMR